MSNEGKGDVQRRRIHGNFMKKGTPVLVMPEKEREENEREGKRKGNIAPRGENCIINVVAPMEGQNQKI